MKKLNIALLSGGISSERDVSIQSGQQVYEALDKDKYNVVKYDPKTDLNLLVKDAHNIDASLIILHGSFGEDGTVQGLLDLLDIPYQGSGVLGSSIGMNKIASKQLYEKAGLKVPPYITLKKNDDYNAQEYIQKLGLPIVVKPVEGGSSIGMSIVKKQEDLQKACDQAFEYDDVVILENFIKGTEVTCGVIGNDETEPLPVIEIIPGQEFEFFDYKAKYTDGATQEICPARISDVMTEKVQQYAKIAHHALFCKGYSRTDMIMQDDELYILETNTIPGMTPNSLLPRAAREGGFSFSDLLDRLIELGIQAHQKRKIQKS